MPTKRHFDIIVAGVGGMGSAAAFELARRGFRVLGLEQFKAVHEFGSSHGQTRIIRTAYYEHPGYVPLVRRAFERWYDLEQISGRKLLTQCGCLTIGNSESEIIQGVRRSAIEHGLAIDQLGNKELQCRFPPFHFDGDFGAVLEHEAGFLYVEECVRSHIETAVRFGAELRFNESVKNWQASNSHIEVTTEQNRYSADRLIVTVGPWASHILGSWGQRLTVMRQTPHWFKTLNDQRFRRDRFPLYIADVAEGCFYGFPVIDSFGHKVARHYGADEQADVNSINRETDSADERAIREFLAKHLPDANGPMTRGQTCIYTLTPDRHFILDRHPEFDRVTIAAGFSGHGFKFAPVVGEILADLALNGRTAHSIEMFRVDRFAK